MCLFLYTAGLLEVGVRLRTLLVTEEAGAGFLMVVGVPLLIPVAEAAVCQFPQEGADRSSQSDRGDDPPSSHLVDHSLEGVSG